MYAISVDMHFVIRMVLVRMIQLSLTEMHKHLSLGFGLGNKPKRMKRHKVQDFFTLKNKRQDHSCQQRSRHPRSPLDQAEFHTNMNCNTKDLHNISKLELINDHRDLGAL